MPDSSATAALTSRPYLSVGAGVFAGEISGVKHVFVCGMPRSGTTILAKEIASFPNGTGFENTGVMMDEGQYLQDVYPTEWACGGAGRFGFSPEAHLTEDSPLLTPANVARLRRSWHDHWDQDKTICVEKTPGNLLKTRFLQASFPNAHFIVIKRHPVAASLATQKWSLTPLHELFEHWLRCHEIFDEDKQRLERLYEVAYEDYVENPRRYLEEIAQFLGAEFSGPIREQAAGVYNQKYFDRWARMLASSPFRAYYREVAKEFEPRFQAHGYSLAPPGLTISISHDESRRRGVARRLFYPGAGVVFGFWRRGRALRIRVEHGTFRRRRTAPEKRGTPGQSTSRLRVLVLAPGADPEGLCAPLLSYSQAEALGRLHDVTLVVRRTSEEVVRRHQGRLHAVEAISQPWLEGLRTWSVRRIFKYNYNSKALTAFDYPFSVGFEWGAWRRLRKRIAAGEFDVALRLMPVPAVLPSPFAFFLRHGPIPFVIGPVSGGLPWPQGFSQADHQKPWISRFRNLYRFLPFSRSTYRHATAIIAGLSQTYAEFAEYREKLFFLLENGVSGALCSDVERTADPSRKLELIFVGGLVPAKACDLALRAAAPLLRADCARFTVVGDGPERARLERLASELGIGKAVSFAGWLSHSDAMRRLRLSDVLVFPSVRDNSPAVVFEALASGAVPVVLDSGGPGDIVPAEFGCKVPLTNETDVVVQMEKILADFARDRDRLERLRQQGVAYTRECLTWDAKAETLTRILNWAARRGPRPSLPPPRALSSSEGSDQRRELQKGQVQS